MYLDYDLSKIRNERQQQHMWMLLAAIIDISMTNYTHISSIIVVRLRSHFSCSQCQFVAELSRALIVVTGQKS